MRSYTCVSGLPCLLLPDVRTFSAPKWHRVTHTVTLARSYVLLLIAAAITILLSELRYEMAALVVAIGVIPADCLINVCSPRQVTLFTIGLYRVE